MRQLFLTALSVAVCIAIAQARSAAAANYSTDLSTLYSLYIEVKGCWEFRRGATFVLISDVEMERARKIIKEMETKIVENMDVDVQHAWKAATARAQDYRDRDSCKARYGFLTNSYKQILPDQNITVKDF